MDLQHILDPYACAIYFISCIAKSQRGMFKLLRDALMHLKAVNATIKERPRGIECKFQNCSISAFGSGGFLTSPQSPSLSV